MDWSEYFTIQDYAADYRTAVTVWTQTDTSKVTLQDVIALLFPQYSPQAVETVENATQPDDDVYEWTWEDRKVFDRILANLPEER